MFRFISKRLTGIESTFVKEEINFSLCGGELTGTKSMLISDYSNVSDSIAAE